jgi:hypothetical protein
MLRLGENGRWRLARTVVAAQVANWFVTLVKAFWHVGGLGPSGHARNDVILAAFTLFVVLPSLVAAAVWIWALSGKPAPAVTAPQP